MKFISLLFTVFVSVIILNCGDDNPSSSGSSNPEAEDTVVEIKKEKLTGYVQKGPFINGTAITVSELKEDLSSTGKTFQSQIIDNKGTFEVKNVVLSSPFVNLRADGFFFNEVSGKKSDAQITLYALSNIKNKSSVNINLLSHLEKSRVEYFIDNDSIEFAEAKIRASKEILKIFNITDSIAEFETLDISKVGEANAILLAISVILLGDRNEADFTELLSNISTDIREDGLLTSVSLKGSLISAAKNLNLAEIRTNIESRYEELGVTTEIGGFEKYIYAFINLNEKIVPEITILSPASKVIDLTVKLSGIAQDFYNGKVIGYKFDFDNDGIWDVEKTESADSVIITENHTYSSYGKKSFTLQVIDSDSNTVEKTEMFEIINANADISLNFINKVTINDIVEFDVVVTDADSTTKIIFDFGEGDTLRPQFDTVYNSSICKISHKYPSSVTNGSEIYAVKVTVIDKFGKEVVKSGDITVYVGTPTIDNVDTANDSKDKTVNFTADVIDFYGGKIASYKYDFDNDGIWDVEKTVNDSNVHINETYTFQSYNDYSWTLFVIDDDGNSTVANGEVFVTGSVIYVTADGDSTNNGYTWETAVNCPQKAFDLAKEKDIHEIWISKGIYYRNPGDEGSCYAFFNEYDSDTIKVIGGFIGTETEKNDRNTNTTILSGDFNEDDTDLDTDGFTDSTGLWNSEKKRVIQLNGPVILDGFGVTGGTSDYGGGMFINNKVSIKNCTIKGNTATESGGGIYNQGGFVSNSIISENISRKGAAGIENNGVVNNCIITGNKGYNSGGIVNSRSGTVSNSTISNNVSNYTGSGILNEGIVTNCIINENLGVGIYASVSYSIIINCVIKNNIGVGVENRGNIENCMISENRGGGIVSDTDQGFIANCTITGNTEGYGVTTNSTIVNSTIVGNTGADTEKYSTEIDIHTEHGFMLINCISGGVYYGENLAVENSIITNCIIEGGLTETDQITNIIDKDPLLSGLVNTGQMAGCNLDGYSPVSVQTMSISSSSPGIDAGIKEYVLQTKDNIEAPTTDARGVVRPQGSGIDIGAYEYK